MYFDLYCVKVTCYLVIGYNGVRWQHCMSCVVILSDSCTTEFECTRSINYSRCWEGFCSCLSGYRQDVADGSPVNNSCIRRELSPPFIMLLVFDCLATN